MPSENKTPNLGLNQWQGHEYIKRQDFVEDNQKIDAAVNEVDDAIKTHQAESASSYIAESGSNENGRYIKFDDGTMICTHKITITGDVSTTIGALYRSSVITWVFPSRFLNDNIGVSSSIGGQTLMFTAGNVVTTSTYSFYPIRPTPLTNITYHIHCIAIGRWK